jgi:hypothetical protein
LICINARANAIQYAMALCKNGLAAMTTRAKLAGAYYDGAIVDHVRLGAGHAGGGSCFECPSDINGYFAVDTKALTYE